MRTLLELGLGNALLAALLAAAAYAVGRCWHKPALSHALWLLVLLKLLTPPFLAIPIAWLPRSELKPMTQHPIVL